MHDVVSYFKLLKDDSFFVKNYFVNNYETEKIIDFSQNTGPVISVAINMFHPNHFDLKRTDVKGTIKYSALYTNVTIVRHIMQTPLTPSFPSSP